MSRSLRGRPAPSWSLAAFLVVALAGAGGAFAKAAWEPREGRGLIGTAAPEWSGLEWIQGGPLTLGELRGQVVLLRFWLGDCPFCQATAPALNQLHRRFGSSGLRVVGLHHPKSARSAQPGYVREAARRLGFEFPVATDDEWTTIRAYGVGTHFRSYTSVSFLIDRAGLIRWVHDGGEYHEGGGPGHEACNAAYVALVAAAEKLLAEPAPGR